MTTGLDDELESVNEPRTGGRWAGAHGRGGVRVEFTFPSRCRRDPFTYSGPTLSVTVVVVALLIVSVPL